MNRKISTSTKFMEVKTITYKRINSLGNYSSEQMEMVAELSADSDVDQCAKDLKDYVETALELKPNEKPF